MVRNIADGALLMAGYDKGNGGPAARYRARLLFARVWWSCFCVALWLFMFFSPAVDADTMRPVTITIVVLWALGFARNGAKRAARRARRHQEFVAAVEDELH
jgi:hypothetical protein